MHEILTKMLSNRTKLFSIRILADVFQIINWFSWALVQIFGSIAFTRFSSADEAPRGKTPIADGHYDYGLSQPTFKVKFERKSISPCEMRLSCGVTSFVRTHPGVSRLLWPRHPIIVFRWQYLL